MIILPQMRDDNWLRDKLQSIWLTYFPDVETIDAIDIRFYGRAKYRLGSIRQRLDRSEIRINSVLADPGVPEFVITEVIAHELTHYTHGFGSTRPQLHPYPHRGGIVNRELGQRGLGELVDRTACWVEAHWQSFFPGKL